MDNSGASPDGDRALVSDQAPAGLAATRFDPSRVVVRGFHPMRSEQLRIVSAASSDLCPYKGPNQSLGTPGYGCSQIHFGG